MTADVNEAPSKFCLADRTPHPIDRVMLQGSILSVFKPTVLDHQCGRLSLDPSIKYTRPTPTHASRPVIVQAVRGPVHCLVDCKGEPRITSVDGADVVVNAQVGTAGSSENGEETNE